MEEAITAVISNQKAILKLVEELQKITQIKKWSFIIPVKAHFNNRNAIKINRFLGMSTE